MTIETDILTTLNNDTDLSAIVSNRNYAVNLPQNPVYPNTVNSRVNSNPTNTLSGRNKLMNIRLQIDVRHTVLEKATDAANKVISAMEKSILFTALYLTDNHLPKENQTDTYRISIDFSVWFTET
ncbi:MAG: DUF3168 domain-containing protein [Thiohalomonadales bacterium]